jgi:hypothetical protein
MEEAYRIISSVFTSLIVWLMLGLAFIPVDFSVMGRAEGGKLTRNRRRGKGDSSEALQEL